VARNRRMRSDPAKTRENPKNDWIVVDKIRIGTVRIIETMNRFQ
jgi:hypothetical protein